MSVLWRKVPFDLWHNKARTLLAVLSIAAGLITIGGIFGLLDQLLSTMDAAHRAVQPVACQHHPALVRRPGGSRRSENDAGRDRHRTR